MEGLNNRKKRTEAGSAMRMKFLQTQVKEHEEKNAKIDYLVDQNEKL